MFLFNVSEIFFCLFIPPNTWIACLIYLFVDSHHSTEMQIVQEGKKFKRKSQFINEYINKIKRN